MVSFIKNRIDFGTEDKSLGTSGAGAIPDISFYIICCQLIIRMCCEDQVNRILPDIFCNRNLAGKFSLKKLLAFLNEVDLFVSNSTGPLHIAGALDTNVLGLYPNLRPASVRRWVPWDQIENCIVAHHPECVKCSLKQCELNQCMNSISVEEVWQKANQILKSE